jgi:hypothetical protein
MPIKATLTPETATAAVKKSFLALKRPLLDAAKTFEGAREKLSELAPKLMGVFKSLQDEATERGFRAPSFVDFVRFYDPSVPTHAADNADERGYRNHRTYYTCDYMRRLTRTPAPRKADPNAGTLEARGVAQGVRDYAVLALARSLATILQVVPDAAPIWKAVQDEFKFSENLMTRLKARVDATEPLLRLKAQRITVGNVIHWEPPAQAEGEEAEPMRQAGRNVEAPIMPAPSEMRPGRARARKQLKKTA